MKVLNNLKLAHQAPNIYRKGFQIDKIKIRVGPTKYLNQTHGAGARQPSTSTWYDIYQYKNEQHWRTLSLCGPKQLYHKNAN